MQNIYSSKRDNTVIPTAVKRNQMIQQLINVDKFGAKSVIDYNLKKGFEVLHVASEYRLIKKREAWENGFKFIIAFEELFETLSSIHSKIGHGGKKRTFKEGQKKWANLTLECCKLFLSFRTNCEIKYYPIKNSMENNSTTFPKTSNKILTKTFNDANLRGILFSP